MILENGRIHTLDPSAPHLRALAITRDGRIARGVEAWEGEVSQVSNERIDLDGRVVVPGFVDAHLHFMSWALQQSMVRLEGCRSIAEVRERVGERLRRDAEAGDAGWLVGTGWLADLLDRAPGAELIDDLSRERPIALWAYDWHTLWLNSAGLRAAGIDAGSSAPDGGVIELDAAGRPSGILREHAAWLVELPLPDAEDLMDIVDLAQREAHRRGVTTIHDFETDPRGFTTWQRLDDDRRLTLRVSAAQRAERLDAALACGLTTGFGNDRLRVGAIKGFMDGTLGSRTAAMLEPFADGGTGMALIDRDELVGIIRRAAEGGLAVAVHAIGDGANRTALDAFELTKDAWSRLAALPRIEHAQLLAEADLTRFGFLGVVASMQPTHATADRDAADAAWGERARFAYAWRSLARRRAVLAFGSDAPIEDVGPLRQLHAAVNRTLPGREPWRPDEALDVGRALEALCVGPHLAAGWTPRVGTLAPGRAADLVVLDRDPHLCDPAEIASIEVVATMVGGRWVHGRPPW